MSTASGDRDDARNTAPTERIEEGRHAAPADRVHDADPNVRREVVAREKEAYGGVKIGAAFFGWLTAMGMAVLLTALVGGTGTAIGLGAGVTEPGDVDAQAAGTITVVGAILVLLIVFLSYYCGGYVAGRMARFSGAKQGVAVWLWALVIAIVVAVIGGVLGANFNVLSRLNAFPRIPVNEGDLGLVSIITLVVVALASLGGAILGGIVGVRYHRKVDKAGLGA
ncbi:MAG: hypothetical protein M3116_03760 [Actinomycetota bacterium]|nr:hypothetical protein [Actinomycetota bacterium]